MPITWEEKGKLIHIGSAVGILALLVAGFLLFNRPAPTCFDGKQNGTEKGVDCGGSCEALCQANFSDPAILWSRAFKVVDGVYHAAALVENPHRSAFSGSALYSFKLYDERGLLIAERKGEAYIPPNSITPIFEPNIDAGNRIPMRATLEFRDRPLWERAKEGRYDLSVDNQSLDEAGSGARLRARIRNEGLETAEDIIVTAVLYDREENAVHASQTKVDTIAPRESENIFFTWPQPFDREVVQIRIFPTVIAP